MVDGAGDEARRTLPEPQAGLTAVLQPYVGFTADYQGQAGTIPIMFTPGGRAARDPMAGKPGYDPNLVAGYSVPMSSRILVMMPNAYVFRDAGGISHLYNWYFIWRQRNVKDFRDSRLAFHYPKQAPGAGGNSVMPAMFQSVVYQDPGPKVVQTLSNGVVASPAFHTVFVEAYVPQTNRSPASNFVMERPFLPGGARGVVEQGILPITTDNGMPAFVAVDLTCLGDDLIIACTKNEIANWNFTAGNPDFGFQQLFAQSQPDIGIFVNPVISP
jgi:hypothetical protein